MSGCNGRSVGWLDDSEPSSGQQPKEASSIPITGPLLTLDRIGPGPLYLSLRAALCCRINICVFRSLIAHSWHSFPARAPVSRSDQSVSTCLPNNDDERNEQHRQQYVYSTHFSETMGIYRAEAKSVLPRTRPRGGGMLPLETISPRERAYPHGWFSLETWLTRRAGKGGSRRKG